MIKPFVSLKTAAEAKGAGVSKETSFKVDPDKIEIEPGFNRPIDPEHVKELKAAIKSGASIPPIYVRVDAGRIVMVDGEHRMLAVKALRKEGMTIPCMTAIQFRGNDAERIAHLLTSARGRHLSPLEAGFQYLKLLKLNWLEQEIADRTGRSITHVMECLQLAEGDTSVHRAIKNKEISSTHALEMMKEHGSNAGKVIADKLKVAKSNGKKKVTTKVVLPKAEVENDESVMVNSKGKTTISKPFVMNDSHLLDWCDQHPYKIKEWVATTLKKGCPLRAFVIDAMHREK